MTAYLLAEATCDCCGSPPVAGTHFAPAEEDEDGRARRDATSPRAVVRMRSWWAQRLRSFGGWHDDGGEAGGWIAGEVEPDGGFLVHDLSEPSDSDERTPSSLVISAGDALHFQAQLPGSTVVGCFHSHASGSPPSDTDVRTWRWMRETLGLARFVGVVLVPDAWRGWDARAYVVGPDGVEPAGIEEV